MSYQCIICGDDVDEDLVVTVFINPPDGSWDTEKSTPYSLSITPCCGKRECVYQAWEQVKKSTIGEVEIGRLEKVEEEDGDDEDDEDEV
jgi:hypothetical protein